MKRVLRNTLTALLVLLLSVNCLAISAAAGTRTEVQALPTTVQIPVTVKMAGDAGIPETDTVKATLEPIDGAPKPKAGTIDVRLTYAQKGGTGNFEVVFDSLGVYKYKLTIYDSEDLFAVQNGARSFTVTVAITNDTSDYNGYIVEIGAMEVGASTKCELDDIVTYVDPVDYTVVKKWVDRDSKRPESITVELYADGQRIPNSSMVLSADNKWTGTYYGLFPGWEITVKEVEVPTGYTASYEYKSVGKNKMAVYITNTGKWDGETLLQTGQLNWPIPVLCIAGVSILAMGIYLSRRKKEENG